MVDALVRGTSSRKGVPVRIRLGVPPLFVPSVNRGMRKQKKYHFVYKTTNPIGRYYIGAHSTDHLEDGYMGSGKILRYSLNKHSKENHKFEILEFCPDRQSLFEREAELVPIELMNDPLCMNLRKGGNGGGAASAGMVSVRDSKGNAFQVRCTDQRYISGELISTSTGKAVVKDKTGRRFTVDCSDPRYISGELVGATKGRVTARDNTGKTFKVDSSDPRYISGELVGTFTGKSHSEETKRKMSEIKKSTGIGDRNSQFGTCWIFSTSLKKSIKIKKNSLEEFIVLGWEPGRKMKF